MVQCERYEGWWLVAAEVFINVGSGLIHFKIGWPA